MKISVIIPVYNAEPFIRRAVESAINLEECGEVVLVEDNSPDNALSVCEELVEEYPNVSLHRHPNNENRGPGPSRNLGVQNSKYNLIAFLDADDIYLPNRFKKSLKILSSNEEIDGVYEPVDCTFQDDESQARYFESHKGLVAMVKKDILPDSLFDCLLSGKHGYIHLNGLLLRKKAFIEAGMLPALRLHEDTSLILKLSLLGMLVAGEKEMSVSTRKLHLKNTFTDPKNDFTESRYLYYKEILEWMESHHIEKRRINLIRHHYYYSSYKFFRRRRKFVRCILSFALCKYSRYAAKDIQL